MRETTGGLEDGLLLRTARKAHKCEGDGSSAHRHADDCPREIKPGERYVECFWEAPAYQSGSRISLACSVAFYDWPARCPSCGGRGWHTAGGNDPIECGRCASVAACQRVR